ncbi:MAG TPA: transporter [Thermoanaerobaculia bacterium]|jgi:hypothetical protein
MLTDDPGTPGNRRWEVNVAFTVEDSRAGRTFSVPLIDANYGLGERIQLKIEAPWLVGKDENGLGNVLLGIKWRFLDEDAHGVALSLYPQIGLRAPAASRKRGLGEADRLYLLPLSARKKLGPVSANAEIGFEYRPRDEDEWIYGLAIGREVSKRLEVIGEVFGSSPLGSRQSDFLLNVGLRGSLNERLVLLLAAGAGLGSRTRETPRLLGYLGGQFLF